MVETKLITKYVCKICSYEHATEDAAIRCENKLNEKIIIDKGWDIGDLVFYNRNDNVSYTSHRDPNSVLGKIIEARQIGHGIYPVIELFNGEVLKDLSWRQSYFSILDTKLIKKLNKETELLMPKVVSEEL